MRYPEISAAMVERQDELHSRRPKPTRVVSTDAGCLMNIGGRMHRRGKTLEVLHIAELLDRR